MRLAALSLPLLLVALAARAAPLAPPPEQRTFSFTYAATIGPVPDGDGPLDVFIPLAQDDDHQTITSLRIDTSVPGEIRREAENGNRFWHGHVDAPSGQTVKVEFTYLVERRVFERERLTRAPRRKLSSDEVKLLAADLGPDARVPVGRSVPPLIPILAEVEAAAGSKDPAKLARSIYDWVVDHVEYKKVGTGWGHGDTYWACRERYGNCTDFHSLFLSLARTEGIPARFEMGFPVPEDRPSGAIGGYHCWLEFWLPGVGWYPVDASEAAKHPERREILYGTHPPDRVLFTTGRDLSLGAGHVTGPLNYFIYPHVERGGALYTGPLEKSFRYEDTEPAPATRVGS